MQSKLLLLLGGVGLALVVDGTAMGQFDLGPPGGGGGLDPSELRRHFLDRMDANGDGNLETNEVPELARGFIGRMARRAGLDPGRPMPIDQLVRGHGYGEESRKSDDRSRYRGKDGDGRGHDGPPRVRTGQNEVPRVAGFGESYAAGFGANPRSLGGRVIDLQRRYDRRVVENAERTMERHDKNGNGLLDHNEWPGVSSSGDPRQSDLDNDGRITKAELAEHLAKRATRGHDSRLRSGSTFHRPPGSGGSFQRTRGRSGRRVSGPNETGRDGFRPGSGASTELLRRMHGELKQRLGNGLSGRSSGRSNVKRPRHNTPGKTPSHGEAYRVEGTGRFRGRMSFRRVTPVLPKTLPVWWERRDVNADGQVTMAEFMTTRSSRMIRDFMDYDLNGDGVITAREAEIVQSDQ